jgi:hypothetical protein
VLGTDASAERVMHVKKDSEHKFVFRYIKQIFDADKHDVKKNDALNECA